MRNTLHFLARFMQLNIVVFSDRVILDVPVEQVTQSYHPVVVYHVFGQWPPCHALISFHSGKYPFHKVQQYKHIHQPAVINDLDVAVRGCTQC